MKRILCLLCILALVFGLLAACGNTEPPLSSSDITGPAEISGNDSPLANIPELSRLAEDISQRGPLFDTAWPENEFTQQVPKPQFETTFSAYGETEFTVVCMATIDQLKDYVKELKKAGFKKNSNTTDENAFGMARYDYTASNKKGYAVEVKYSNMPGSISTLTIKKPA